MTTDHKSEQDKLQTPRRYMGRPEDDPSNQAGQAAPVAVDEFAPGSQMWLHVPPTSQNLMLVDKLGEGGGRDITTAQRDIVQRAGWCDAVAYHASFDQYWKMPSHGSILNMPKHYGIAMPSQHLVKVRSQLVKADQAKGFWFLVRIRTEEELALEEGF